jgi:PAS domain S-box-containing protein
MSRKAGKTLSAAGQKAAQAPIRQTEPLPRSADNLNALSDSEARFRAIFENAAVGIARVGPDGRWLEVNQRLCDIVGYSREELMTRTFADITHPDDLDEDVGALRRMLASEIDTHSMKKRYFRKNGSVVWVNLTVSMTRKADGSPDYFISIVEDITESKQAEEAKLKRVALRADVSAVLAEHGQPLQSMLQKSAEALVRHLDAAFARIWTLNQEKSLLELQASAGLYTHLNGRHSRVPIGELKIGTIARERQPHLTNDVVNDPRISDPEWAKENGIVAFAGYPLLVEDRLVGVMAMFARHPLNEDTVEAIANIAAPIAQGIERKRAEEALRASEEQFRILADTAPVMIWTAGTNKSCTFFNQPWLDFTGRAMEEELGLGWTESVHREDYERCMGVYVTSFEMREPFEMEYRMRRHDGEYRWILDHGAPRFSPGGDFLGYIGSCIDITERKQAEAEREQLAREQVAREAAEAANRSKDEFLALVSHELRSPLNAILGYARMLRACSLDKAAADNAAAVERNAKAQLQIIEDLLDSARIVTGKLRIEPGPVDLAPTLEAALDTLRPAAEAKGVTLVADFGPAPVEALGDSMRLQQVVWNLLSNAVKFTPEGGRVELRMEEADDDVRITVSDTGKGIEPEFLPFVFDWFRQAGASGARRHGGLGLGLSLAKHLVELHGGTITAASDGPGRGATFTVRLPRRHPAFVAPPTVASAEGAVAPRADLSLEGVKVLAVDDQEDARMILTQTLGEYGAQVTAVSSGAEALALLSDPSKSGPDALILDIAMPDEDGYTVLKKVRELEARQGHEADRIPAVALTAFGRSEDRLRALKAGFQMHVAKPVAPDELAIVIASLMDRRVGERTRKE